MNTVAKLNQKIQEISGILNKCKSELSKAPNDLSHSLSLITVEGHLAELQAQLRHEKDVREKEVIELRLKGYLAENGTIPLSLLGDIVKSVANAISSTSQRLRKGTDPKRNISKEIINTLDLRLSGISAGSTRLHLTGKTAPDLFGYSLLENALENTFGLLNAQTPDELTESASKVGIRGTVQINRFLKKLSSTGLEVDVSWSSPTYESHKWSGTKDRILSISNTLESITSPEPEYIDFEGELVMASLRGQFEVRDEEENLYRGTFPSQLLERVKGLHIGETIKGMIEKKTILNETTGYKKDYYTMIEVKTRSESKQPFLFPKIT